MDCIAHQAPLSTPVFYTGVGCHFLLQGIFPTQGLNLGLPHCGRTLYPLSHQGSSVPNLPVLPLNYSAFLVAHSGKNLPAMRETWVQSLGQEDPLEKGSKLRFLCPLIVSSLETGIVIAFTT